MDGDVFPGLRPAMEACFLDWEDYPIPGVTYSTDASPAFHCPFTCFRHGDSNKDFNTNQVYILFYDFTPPCCKQYFITKNFHR